MKLIKELLYRLFVLTNEKLPLPRGLWLEFAKRTFEAEHAADELKCPADFYDLDFT